MIDVGSKKITSRVARARAVVRLTSKTLKRILDDQIPKGDVLGVARIAAIQAAKNTPDILPLCHPIPLTSLDVDIRISRKPPRIAIETVAKATWKTGVEMEALCASAAAALCIYDMCKSLERGIVIESIALIEKSGGRSGTWRQA